MGSRIPSFHTSNLNIKTASSIHEIDPDAWNGLSNGRPFQSHRWYVYGEQVMADCPAIYLLVYNGPDLIARASLWLARSEPIPQMLGPFRKPTAGFVKRWPPLICRSPIAGTSGLILPEQGDRPALLAALAQAALAEAGPKKASFVVFDYLDENTARDWPGTFVTVRFSDPGTIMQNCWNSLDEYLAASINKKNRRHYKHTINEIESMGVHLHKYKRVPDIEAALQIIRNVERRHGSPSNPWARAMLENIELMDGTWLDARIGDRLVGGMLLLEDNGGQITTLPGLAEDASYVYFLLLFASLETAFENKVRLLRWGSGAYEAKRRLGFELENNNFVAASGTNWLAQSVVRALVSRN